jgi:hypothetical protein
MSRGSKGLLRSERAVAQRGRYAGQEDREQMVQIRLALESDAQAIAAIYRPVVESTVISFETVPPDRGEIARRIVYSFSPLF